MRASVLIVGLLGLGLVAACSGDDLPTADVVDDAADASADGGHNGPFGTGDGGVLQPGTACSADMQTVVDDDGEFLRACPADQGCAGGTCIPACDAASEAKGSIGCDFYAPEPPFFTNGNGSTFDGPCYAVFVVNAWSRPAKIIVSRGGQTFDLTEFGRIPNGLAPNIVYDPVPATGVPPNQVAVLFLSHKPDASHGAGSPLTCPVPPAYLDDAAVSGTGAGEAFHIASDTPITAYDILPYGGAASYLPSASLLFPSTAWGTNYYVVAPHADGGGHRWMLVVGSIDGTQLTVANPGDPQPKTYELGAGDTLQWIGSDPSGTVLQSTHPVGVFAGSTYLKVKTATSPKGGAQDSAHQQIPHINALGSEYVAPGIVTRLASLAPESVTYQMIGVVDGTTLSYDPEPSAEAPVTLGAGQVVEFETTSLFVVKSQDDDHPFGMMQYMPGSFAKSRPGCGPSTACGLGDEDWVNVLAPRQFLRRYVFFADPTYATTNLVITRVRGANGFADVSIDCLEGNVTDWQDVDTAGTFQVAHVDLVRGAKPVGQCNGSRHEAKSAGPFGVTVWGTDGYASYGYPAGGNVASTNQVIVPPPMPK